MKLPDNYDLVRNMAKTMDQSLTKIEDNLRTLVALGIVPEHEAEILLTMWALNICKWVEGSLPKKYAWHIIEELCEED